MNHSEDDNEMDYFQFSQSNKGKGKLDNTGEQEEDNNNGDDDNFEGNNEMDEKVKTSSKKRKIDTETLKLKKHRALQKKRLTQRLECPIGRSLMIRPVSLVTCGHTFDKKNIQAYIDNLVNDSSLTSPSRSPYSQRVISQSYQSTSQPQTQIPCPICKQNISVLPQQTPTSQQSPSSSSSYFVEVAMIKDMLEDYVSLYLSQSEQDAFKLQQDQQYKDENVTKATTNSSASSSPMRSLNSSVNNSPSPVQSSSPSSNIWCMYQMGSQSPIVSNTQPQNLQQATSRDNVCWYWNDDNIWKVYDANMTKTIEMAHSQNLPSVPIINGQYKIVFNTMVQVNVQTKYLRTVERFERTDNTTKWEWRDDQGQWHPFSSNIENQIEGAYQLKLDRLYVRFTPMNSSQSYSYIIDIASMTQINASTRMKRPLKRTTNVP